MDLEVHDLVERTSRAYHKYEKYVSEQEVLYDLAV